MTDEDTDLDYTMETHTLLSDLRSGLPWYFKLDELIHHIPDRLLLHVPGYHGLRCRLCNWVDDRLLEASPEEAA